MSMKPMPPRGSCDRERDDGRMLWVAAGLLAVGLLGLVFLGLNERSQKADGPFNPPVTTGQGKPAPAPPTTQGPPNAPR